MFKTLKKRWFGNKKRRALSVPDVGTRLDQLKSRLPDATQWQLEIIHSVEPFTMTSPERILSLCEATRYLVRNQIEGDIVECGVWRGGSMSAAARTLQHMRASNRDLWMYDTYEGMAAPSKMDVDFLGRTAAELMQAEDAATIPPDGPDSIWCQSPLEGVRETMRDTEYPFSKIRFIKGMVEDTLPEFKPSKIALLRLDTDWYESTKCELEQLFPLLSPGGVLIVDDYGHWNGCRRAVDEYFQQHQVCMLLNRIDYTARIGIHAPAVNKLSSRVGRAA